MMIGGVDPNDEAVLNQCFHAICNASNRPLLFLWICLFLSITLKDHSHEQGAIILSRIAKKLTF